MARNPIVESPKFGGNPLNDNCVEQLSPSIKNGTAMLSHESGSSPATDDVL